MFGSGLPVCALSYSCIGELVRNGQTGLLFQTPEQLSQHLQSVLQGFPARPNKLLQHMRACVAQHEQGFRWEENWNRIAWPVLQKTR